MKGVKFLIFLAFLASAASVTGNWFLYQGFQEEKAIRSELEANQIQLEERNASLEAEVAQIGRLKQEMERLRTQVKDQVSQRDTLRKELDGAYNEVTALKKQVKDLEAEKKSLTEQLNVGQVTETAIAREAAKVVTAPAPPAAPEKKVEKSKEAEKPKKSKKESDKKKKEAEEAQKAEIEKQKPVPTSPATTDQRPLQVLSVNRQFKFVVINVGIRGKLKIGDTLRVEQDGKLVGRIQVEKLYENFSACNIVEEVKPAQIREGDLVRIA